tara:strand:+ start:197 stop:430 length:234 start_codon:yes stop_codon:yes gene_type:complete
MKTATKRTFNVGDKVQSAHDSSDVKLMEMVWTATIIRIVGDNDMGGCYETLGAWDNDPDADPTLRQLCGVHLEKGTA